MTIAPTYPGLLLSDADKHQAFYQGLLNAGANMGGASRLPSSFLERLSKGAAAFGQGQQNALNQTRQQQMQNMQAQAQQQQMAAQQQKMEAMKAQQQQAAVQAQNLKNLQAVFSNPNATPQQKQAAISAAYPQMYAKQHLASTMPAPTTSRPSAPIQNYAQRTELVQKFGENSPQVRQFDNYVRATQYQNTGSEIIAMNPQNPAAPIVAAEMQLKPGERPEVRGAQAEETAAGKIRGETAQQAQIDYPKLETDAEEMMGLLDKLEQHPGLEGVVGMPNLAGMTRMPGTPESDFRVLLDQVVGKQFMEAYQSLKGGGVITEVEGQKATDALARMNTSQTEASFKEAVKDFKRVIERGIIRAQERAGKSASSASPQQTDLKKKYGLE